MLLFMVNIFNIDITFAGSDSFTACFSYSKEIVNYFDSFCITYFDISQFFAEKII